MTSVMALARGAAPALVEGDAGKLGDSPEFRAAVAARVAELELAGYTDCYQAARDEVAFVFGLAAGRLVEEVPRPAARLRYSEATMAPAAVALPYPCTIVNTEATLATRLAAIKHGLVLIEAAAGGLTKSSERVSTPKEVSATLAPRCCGRWSWTTIRSTRRRPGVRDDIRHGIGARGGARPRR